MVSHSRRPWSAHHLDSFRSRLRSLEEGLKQAPADEQVEHQLHELELAIEEIEVADEAIASQTEQLIAAREELEAERLRFHNLFHFAPYGYLVTDLAGTMQEANRTALDLLQIAASAASGKPLAVFVAAEDLPRFRSLLMRLRTADRVDEWEVTLHPRRRPAVRAVVTVSRQQMAPPALAVLLWAVRDVTAVRATESALRESEERLRHAQRLEAVGRLAGGIAHSFNNLLAAMAFHVDLLGEGLSTGREPARLHHYLEELRQARERASALASQLLAFSRRQVLQPRVLSINDVIAAMEPMVSDMLGESVTLALKLAPDAGAIHFDLAQLEQLLLNLLVNARDAMLGGGRCTIETAAVGVGEDDGAAVGGLAPGRYVRLTVTDTGVGMGPEVLPRIFEPFFTTKENGKGTGLGLSTVYGIVQQGNGRVVVDSAPERGARFEVYLPQTTDAPEPVLPGAPTLAPPAGTELILLVEDEESIRLAAQEVLENRGYRVLSAADGGEALRLAAAQGERFDLLVTDVVIPGMSGVQLANRLSEGQPDLRVLYMSGYPEDSIDDLRRLDPGSFLQKPFPPAQFLRAVRAVLDRSAGRDGATAAGGEAAKEGR